MRGSAAFRTGVAPGGVLAPAWVRDALWRNARAVPSLDLNFAANKSLVDATTGQNLVTFTRASSGTYVGSDGVLKTATTNLLLRSEEFDNAYWTKTNSTVTANATTAPNGALTAEKLITNSGASSGRVNVSITATADTPVTLSCYAKQGETNIFGLFISDGITGRAADFNLTTGTVSGTPTAGMTASIQPVGDGWYRCVVTVAGASLSGTTRSLRIVQTVVANDGTSGLFIWGAQFEQSTTAGEYIPTTSTINSAPRFDHNPTTGESLGLLVEEQRTNSLAYSEDIDNATWAKLNTTVGSNVTTSPSNSLNADKLTATATNGEHITDNSFSVTSGTTYTFTAFVKTAGLTDIGLRFTIGSLWTGSVSPQVRFNLTDGTATIVAGSPVSSSITTYPNGWFRVSMSVVSISSGTAAARLQLMSGPNNTFAGNDTDGVFVWGAQLEAGAFPTSYIPTTTATATRNADVASITGTNFSSWYRQDEGTVFAEWFGGPVAANKYPSVIAARQTSANNSQNTIEIFQGPSLTNVRAYGLVRVLNVDQVVRDSGDLTLAGTKVKAALGVRTNDFVFTANGVQVGAVDTSGTLLTVDTLNIGFNSSTDQLGGRISRLTYWPARLPNPTLQAITQ